ncbi:MAG: family 20 glycosylhydrolase [Sphingobacterium sp.]|nr:family 20 glycosylhydrolase [Sphingobacterium sp.]
MLTLAGAEGASGTEGYKPGYYKKDYHPISISSGRGFHGCSDSQAASAGFSRKGSKIEEPLKIATGTILDNPVYSYRGAMLDVSRHFFEVADVKKFIDYLASL